MPYDSAEYTVHQIFGPVLATFASALIKVTASATIKSGTSANLTDRIKFFKNVKITGMRTISRAVSMLTGAVSDHNLRVCLYNTTGIIGSCAIGTVAGVSTAGSVSSTAHADAGEQCQLKLKATGDGTAGTFDQVSADVYIEYQNRF